MSALFLLGFFLFVCLSFHFCLWNAMDAIEKTFCRCKSKLHKRVFLVFVYTADICFIYNKPSRLGGFASEGNHKASVCMRAKIARWGCLVVFCLGRIASFLSRFV